MFTPNEGFIDRLVRVIVGGVALISGILFLDGAPQLIVSVIATAITFTGFSGFCGLYSILKLNTCKINEKPVSSKQLGLLAILLVLIIFAGYVFQTINSTINSPKSGTDSVSSQSLTTPLRTAEINGYVTNIIGNEVVIENEIGVKEVSAEERARRQKLTMEERQALKAQESANLTKEPVTFIIPVGVTIVKGSGVGDGSNIKAEMSDLTKGAYVSIWKSGESIEFVKLKGVSNQ